MASASARFRFPGAQFGIVLGTRRLAERIDADAARELITCGGELDTWKAEAAGLATLNAESPPADWSASQWSPTTARAVRAAVRTDGRDADLAALMRSAAEPGLKARIGAYRRRLLDTR